MSRPCIKLGSSISTERKKNPFYKEYLKVMNEKEYNLFGHTIISTDDLHMANIICMLNILGKPYYDQLLLQEIQLPENIIEIIEREFK